MKAPFSMENYATAGIEDKLPPGATEVKIYPNPTTGKLKIDCGSPPSNGIQLQVINSAGQMIINKFIGTDPEEIDLSGNVSGFYYIKILQDSGTRTEKIVLR